MDAIGMREVAARNVAEMEMNKRLSPLNQCLSIVNRAANDGLYEVSIRREDSAFSTEAFDGLVDLGYKVDVYAFGSEREYSVAVISWKADD